MPRSRRRTTTFLAAGLAALFATTGCSAGQDGQAVAAGPSPSAGAERQPSDPSGWTLPLMAYRPTKEQRSTLVAAERTLVRTCMKDFGLRWAPPAELPVVGPRNEMDWRYGIHDAAAAATRGFQPDPAQVARYEQALRTADAAPRRSPDVEVVLGGSGLPPEVLAGAGPEVRAGTFRGRKIPKDGCFGEARRRLGTETYGATALASGLFGRSFHESLKDPAVKAVFARWSACMKGKGFTYKDPVALFDDERFGRKPHPVTLLETSTAVADTSCRGALRVAEVWHAAETRLQQGYVRAHLAELEADRRAVDTSVRNATEALATG
ncbi:hypothetical protein LG634_21750 [Streptomyces bambusae]|uniref:hypothetical protein n=1 Tax=Streptomyces bambusae TaxID=1550616 RepID=UPI001CFC4F6C|nr:hypothetical protein [Streptomyces bambusae]MCB5167441.1 hypothetical protein [Streptomyces bambusae]